MRLLYRCTAPHKNLDNPEFVTNPRTKELHERLIEQVDDNSISRATIRKEYGFHQDIVVCVPTSSCPLDALTAT